MRKQFILIMQGNQYPFGVADQRMNGKSGMQVRTLVRKSYQIKNGQGRGGLIDKINLLKNIQCGFLIKIQTVLQEENNIHVLYEYVPISLSKNIKSYNLNNLEQIRGNMLELGAILGEHGIIAEWELNNVGVSYQVETKYYVDLQKIRLKKQVGGIVSIQKMHSQNIISIFSEFLGNRINYTKKSTILSQTKQQQNDPPPPPSRAQSKQLSQNHQRVPSKAGGHKQKQQQRNQGKSSIDNQKIIDQNNEIMFDFHNVLDDHSQRQKGKYLNVENGENQDEIVHIKYDQQGEEQCNKQITDQDNEQQQIIWMSVPSKTQQSNSPHQASKNDQQQQVIWVDYRDSIDIRERAQAAIRRSTKVLGFFKSILYNCQDGIR